MKRWPMYKWHNIEREIKTMPDDWRAIIRFICWDCDKVQEKAVADRHMLSFMVHCPQCETQINLERRGANVDYIVPTSPPATVEELT